jgi:hypothetical protein
LKFIDLAGSEKISKEPFKYINKEHANELIKINKSLSTLGQCIQSLYNKYNFIPYRNSKLTRIIGDSLNGLNDINIIICLSSSKSCILESIGTLKFAQRAKNIILPVNSVKINNEIINKNDVDNLIEELEKEKKERIRLETLLNDLNLNKINKYDNNKHLLLNYKKIHFIYSKKEKVHKSKKSKQNNNINNKVMKDKKFEDNIDDISKKFDYVFQDKLRNLHEFDIEDLKYNKHNKKHKHHKHTN